MDLIAIWKAQYTLEDHPEVEKCYDTLRGFVLEDNIPRTFNEACDSLNKFCEKWGIDPPEVESDQYQVSIHPPCKSGWRGVRDPVEQWLKEELSNYHNDHPEENSPMKGVRLWKWLQCHEWVEKGKVKDCPLTGMCYDHYVLDPISEFLKKPTLHWTLADLVEACLYSWAKQLQKDFEFHHVLRVTERSQESSR
jgi:hypothetical protein